MPKNEEIARETAKELFNKWSELIAHFESGFKEDAEFHILRTLEQSEGWVSVKDRLPDDFQRVIVFGHGVDRDGDKVYQIIEANYDSETKVWSSWGDMQEPITHWRPLPSPPNSEETANG